MTLIIDGKLNFTTCLCGALGNPSSWVCENYKRTPFILFVYNPGEHDPNYTQHKSVTSLDMGYNICRSDIP